MSPKTLCSNGRLLMVNIESPFQMKQGFGAGANDGYCANRPMKWYCGLVVLVIHFLYDAIREKRETETIKPALCPPQWKTAAVNFCLHEQQHWCSHQQKRREVLQAEVLTFKKTKRLILLFLLCCVSFCQTLICLTAALFKKAFIFKPMQHVSVKD